MFNRTPTRPSNIFMRLRTEEGEAAVFKDDKDRFTSDINKTNTLKLRVDTIYLIALECPQDMTVKSLSIMGAPVKMDSEHAAVRTSHQSDGVKAVSLWRWSTEGYLPSLQSCRTKLDLVVVVEIDGLRGPNSDEQHLLKTKLICKFYSRDHEKFAVK